MRLGSATASGPSRPRQSAPGAPACQCMRMRPKLARLELAAPPLPLPLAARQRRGANNPAMPWPVLQAGIHRAHVPAQPRACLFGRFSGRARTRRPARPPVHSTCLPASMPTPARPTCRPRSPQAPSSCCRPREWPWSRPRSGQGRVWHRPRRPIPPPAVDSAGPPALFKPPAPEPAAPNVPRIPSPSTAIFDERSGCPRMRSSCPAPDGGSRQAGGRRRIRPRPLPPSCRRRGLAAAG